MRPSHDRSSLCVAPLRKPTRASKWKFRHLCCLALAPTSLTSWCGQERKKASCLCLCLHLSVSVFMVHRHRPPNKYQFFSVCVSLFLSLSLQCQLQRHSFASPPCAHVLPMGGDKLNPNCHCSVSPFSRPLSLSLGHCICTTGRKASHAARMSMAGPAAQQCPLSPAHPIPPAWTAPCASCAATSLGEFGSAAGTAECQPTWRP